jgi:hypothetical protein
MRADLETLNIIHLADFHMRKDKNFAGKLGVIVNNLIKSLEELVKNQVLSEGKFVFAVTGDLSHSGKKEEFELFEQHVHDKLKNFLKKKGGAIVYSPGNHDFDEDSDQAACNRELLNNLMNEDNREKLDEASKSISQYFKGNPGAPHLRNSMVNYYDFIQDANPDQIKDYPAPCLHNMLEFPFGDHEFFFVSLNSGYLRSSKYEYQGYIGKPQIDQAFERIMNKRAEGEEIYIFTLFHHPFDAIVPVSQYETYKNIIRWSDLILTGHVHYLRVYADLARAKLGYPAVGYPLLSHSRCVYDETQRPDIVTPGFSIISLDFSARPDPTKGNRKYLRGEHIIWMKYKDSDWSWEIDSDLKHNPQDIPGFEPTQQ